MGRYNPPANFASQQLNILLVGPGRTGKSSTGNTLLGQGPVFDTKGGAASTAANTFTAGRYVNVVDAKGWGPSEGFVPREEKIEQLRALSLCEPGGPHVVLLVIPLLDFTEHDRRAVESRMEVFTSAVWRHTMVLFTCGDRLRETGQSVEEHIKSGGPDLQWLMEKCRYRYHAFDNKAAVIGKQERRTDGRKKQEGAWWKKVNKGAGRKSTEGEADGGKEVVQEQVRELLGKVEDMLQENGGWHFSLHMYQRMEEEWNRREQELRARLEAERKPMPDMDPEQRHRLETEEEREDSPREEQEIREEYVEREMNRGEDKEDIVMVRLQRQSSEESSYGSEEEREGSTEVKTRMMAPCRFNGDQRLAFSPIRRLS